MRSHTQTASYRSSLTHRLAHSVGPSVSRPARAIAISVRLSRPTETAGRRAWSEEMSPASDRSWTNDRGGPYCRHLAVSLSLLDRIDLPSGREVTEEGQMEYDKVDIIFCAFFNDLFGVLSLSVPVPSINHERSRYRLTVSLSTTSNNYCAFDAICAC